MVAGVAAGNISREATPPFGNIYAEAMRGVNFPCETAAIRPYVDLNIRPIMLSIRLCRVSGALFDESQAGRGFPEGWATLFST